ncbi:MAG TPA: hypothetical protein VF331_16075, partial [Polyangiales bacterium]
MSQAGRATRARIRRAAVSAAQAAASEAASVVRPPRRDARFLVASAAQADVTPDLLDAVPAVRLDVAALEHALSFAFLAGSSGGALGSALCHAAVAPSDWAPDNFADALFIDELISGCFGFSIAGRPAPIDRPQLRKLLCQPPKDLPSVLQRQAVLAELTERPQLLAALERVYQAIVTLCGLLDDEGSDSRLDMTQWRLDVLTALRDAILSL